MEITRYGNAIRRFIAEDHITRLVCSVRLPVAIRGSKEKGEIGHVPLARLFMERTISVSVHAPVSAVEEAFSVTSVAQETHV